MSVATIPALTLDAAIGASAGSTSSAKALPGTPASDALVLVTNLGPCHAALKLGTSSAVSVTPSTGVVVLAGHELALAIGVGDTYIAIVSCGGTGTTTTLNIATGT